MSVYAFHPAGQKIEPAMPVAAASTDMALWVCCSDPALWTSNGAAATMVERDVMLHAPAAFPRSAIAAAKVVLWDCPSTMVPPSAGASAAAEGPADSAEALLWVHPAGYTEVLAALQACCTQQGVAITDRCWTPTG